MYNPQLTYDRIITISKSRGITIKNINEKCSLGTNALSQAAKSEYGMKAKNLYMISELLECSVDYLLGRTTNTNFTSNDNNIQSSNIVNGNNGDHSPLTLNNEEKLDEMTSELVKAFKDLPFKDKLDILNTVMEKKNNDN